MCTELDSNLDRGERKLFPCEEHIDTDVNSFAYVTVLGAYSINVIIDPMLLLSGNPTN